MLRQPIVNFTCQPIELFPSTKTVCIRDLRRLSPRCAIVAPEWAGPPPREIMLRSNRLVLSAESAMSLDGGNETVASATDRRYVAITATALSERSSQCCDSDLEITLRHT